MSYAALIISLIANLALLLAFKKATDEYGKMKGKYKILDSEHYGLVMRNDAAMRDNRILWDDVAAYSKNTAAQAKKLCTLARKLAQAKRALRIAKITRKVVVK
jgi:hypothetical protein